jgi:hypothetical protein
MKNSLTKVFFCKPCEKMTPHVIIYRENVLIKSTCLCCLPNNFGSAILHSIKQIEDTITYAESVKK